MLELLHTFGLCLLVFRVLPLFDMLRGLIVLGSIYLIPAVLKAMSEITDKSSGWMRKLVLFAINIGVVIIQTGSIVACFIFRVAMTTEEKHTLKRAILAEDLSGTVPRPPLVEDPTIIWELPVALFCISMAYLENFIDGDLEIFGKTIRIQSWKKYLHHARSRLYIIASVWKTLWVIAFAMLLQPGFNFNMSYTVQAGFEQTYENTSLISNTNITDTNSSNANSLVSQEVFNPFSFSHEVIKHFELYGLLYVQLFAVIVLTYCGSLACKMCMQLFGFSLPLILTTPLTTTVVVLQCMYQFLPTGVFVWISYEEEGNRWILDLAWLLVLWLSELFITSHIWFPNNGRMEKTDRYLILFLKELYGFNLKMAAKKLSA